MQDISSLSVFHFNQSVFVASYYSFTYNLESKKISEDQLNLLNNSKKVSIQESDLYNAKVKMLT